MANDGDLFKREEDRKWREKVDHEQVTMMTAINVLQDGAREIKSRLREVEVTLRGEKEYGGLVAEYDRHDAALTRLNAVIFQDATGKKGMMADIDHLMGRKTSEDRRSERRWSMAEKLLAGLVAGIFALAAATVTHLDSVIPELQQLEAHFGRRPTTKKPPSKSKRSKRHARSTEDAGQEERADEPE